MTPQEALNRAERREIELAFATRTVLRGLSAFTTPDEALAYARSLGSVECNRPNIAQGHQGERIFRLMLGPGQVVGRSLRWSGCLTRWIACCQRSTRLH